MLWDVVADTLIHAGADLDARDNEKQTALHITVQRGCAATLEYLILSGANCITVRLSVVFINYPTWFSCQDAIVEVVKHVNKFEKCFLFFSNFISLNIIKTSRRSCIQSWRPFKTVYVKYETCSFV